MALAGLLSLRPAPVAAAAVFVDEPEQALFYALGTPSDPYFSRQWGLPAVNWNAAFDAGSTGVGVVVAVLDSGVTPNPQLQNVVAGWNFIGDNSNTADDNGHGTHVAGTVAQTTNDGVGTAGVAGGARILPVKVLDADGVGPDSAIIAGIEYAVANGAHVINLSIGGDSDGGVCNAVTGAVRAGVTVVAAAGNSGGPVSFPAACPNAIGVSASTMTGTIAGYSNRGPQISVAAPGGDNRVDSNGDGYPDGILQYSVFNGKGGYYFQSGTSMAAPHVAGAAALVKEAKPSITPADVKRILTATASDRGAAGRDDEWGYGLLDIGAAVAAAGGTSSSTPTTTTPTAEPDTGAAPVSRLAGDSRWGTAAAIGADGWGTGAANVYLASGRTFADALATGALSGVQDGPLLLADQCSLPADTSTALDRLKPQQVTIVGGPAAICDAIADQLKSRNITVARIAGPDRYATAVALSRTGWADGRGSTAYLASGANFADALGGAAQAAHEGAPLLLTEGCRLPAAVAAELARLRTTNVTVLGGTGAVCDGVVQSLQSSGIAVTRVAGADRYATAVQGVAAAGWQTADTVYLASGTAFPDGLAVGPLAAKNGAPLLLVPSCDLPATVSDALTRLQPRNVVVVGGAAAVCDNVLQMMGR